MRLHTYIRELLDMSKDWGNLMTSNFLDYKKLPFYTASGLPMEPITLTSSPLIFKTKFTDHPTFKWTTIFEYEGWFIESVSASFPPGPAGYSLPPGPDTVSHYCPVLKWKKQISPYHLIADGVCPVCCVAVPDEVMGVWKLKNFNNLPSLSEATSTIAQNIALGAWDDTP